MKIRIVQSGYQTFNGLLGDVKFEDGVSVGEVSAQQAAYVGAMFTVATFDEEAPSSEQKETESSAQGSELTSQGQRAESDDAPAEADAPADAPAEADTE